MLKKMEKSDFDEIYSLIQDTFPIDEYRPYYAQLQLFTYPDYCVYGYYDNELKGILATWEIDDFCYIEHFAVKAQWRNQGIGALMLEELKKTSHRQVVLEVEVPRTDLQKRRIQFYQRNGFYLNDLIFYMPPLDQKQDKLELMLMNDGEVLTSQELDKILYLIKNRVYLLKDV